jgi:hypothetical protein
MHPELACALARQYTKDRLQQEVFRHSRRRVGRRRGSQAPGVLERARRRVGSALLDVGVHLMTTSTWRQEPGPAQSE